MGGRAGGGSFGWTWLGTFSGSGLFGRLTPRLERLAGAEVDCLIVRPPGSPDGLAEMSAAILLDEGRGLSAIAGITFLAEDGRHESWSFGSDELTWESVEGDSAQARLISFLNEGSTAERPLVMGCPRAFAYEAIGVVGTPCPPRCEHGPHHRSPPGPFMLRGGRR